MSASERSEMVRRAIEALSCEKKRLSSSQLENFATPITWEQIYAIEPVMPRSWWRHAVVDADEYGRGLLRWVPHASAWVLTDLGRSVAGLRLHNE